jgi:hypothetical protein
MASTYDTIDHSTVQRLVEAGSVHGAKVIGQPGGWTVVIKYGMIERPLVVRRGAVRVFRKFETLVAYLRSIGISNFRVHTADFDPDATTRPARPDVSHRMRRALEAAAHIDAVKKSD